MPYNPAGHAQGYPDRRRVRKHGEKRSGVSSVATPDAGQRWRYLFQIEGTDGGDAQGLSEKLGVVVEPAQAASARSGVMQRGRDALCRDRALTPRAFMILLQHTQQTMSASCRTKASGAFLGLGLAHLHPRVLLAVFFSFASLARRVGVPEVHGQSHLCSETEAETGLPLPPTMSPPLRHIHIHVHPQAEIDDVLPRHR